MSSNSMTRYPWRLVAMAAIVLAAALTASPLLVVAAIAAPFCIIRCAHGLPQQERHFLIGLLSLALLIRAALAAAQMLQGLPLLNDMSIGALDGDESYYLSRALRVRDLMLGYAATKYDYFVATDAYGQTSYLSMLTWLQVAFGPTPYSMKVVNGLIYVCGAGLLFRMAHVALGTLPSFLGLTVLLFLPSLLFSSVSLLKESAYFFAAALCVTCSWQAILNIREARWRRAMVFAIVTVLSLVALDGLRRGGLVLMGSGLLVALTIWLAGRSRARIAVAIALVVVAVTAVVTLPAARTRTVNAIESAAKVHGGHVFTVGHVYKLMDDGFYGRPAAPIAWDLHLSGPQALRFLARAAISFVVTPWPWEMRSTSELAFMPEHVTWYLMIAALPFGVVAGWRINPLATALFLGFAIPTAAAVALTNGNVGTLLRMRGLVTPSLVWISALGWCAIGEWFAAARPALTERPAL